MLNKMNGLMMECGVAYEAKKLAGIKYFARLTDDLQQLDYVPQSVIEMMKFSRAAYDLFQQTQSNSSRRWSNIRKSKNGSSG